VSTLCISTTIFLDYRLSNHFRAQISGSGLRSQMDGRTLCWH